MQTYLIQTWKNTWNKIAMGLINEKLRLYIKTIMQKQNIIQTNFIYVPEKMYILYILCSHLRHGFTLINKPHYN